MEPRTAPSWARALWPGLSAGTVDEPLNDEPARRYQVVCFARHEASRRHLAPIAAAGAWPLMEQDADLRSLRGAVVVCAFSSDESFVMRHGARGTVLCEHGAGQSYLDPSLPVDSQWRGGRGECQGRLLFLAPGSLIAQRHRKAHSHIPVKQIGCPVLDAWHGRVWQRTGPRVRVCISSHWDCRALPETRSAWPWIRDHLAPLAECPEIELLGHYHPHEAKCGTLDARLADYAALNIPVIHSWDDVMETADLFISDNSSTLYEFAATGRPVVCLNPSWYRRSARHGLRFYRNVPGILVNKPADLLPTVLSAINDPEPTRTQRARAVKAAYGILNGKASKRAVDAVRELVGIAIGQGNS